MLYELTGEARYLDAARRANVFVRRTVRLDGSEDARGAVKGDPESCSAYSPYGHFCGELRPTGSAPGSASVSKPLPKPER